MRFDATVLGIDSSAIVRLPQDISEELPSRGQVAVQATLNGHAFRTVLEPDGRSGHWLRIERDLQQTAGICPGDTVAIGIELAGDWPEPGVPDDLAAALAAAPQEIRDLWGAITPMARWEWVRWVNATNNPATRQRRVEVTIAKMQNGKRRPCCFNLAACTDPSLSRNGRLVEPV